MVPRPVRRKDVRRVFWFIQQFLVQIRSNRHADLDLKVRKRMDEIALKILLCGLVSPELIGANYLMTCIFIVNRSAKKSRLGQRKSLYNVKNQLIQVLINRYKDQVQVEIVKARYGMWAIEIWHKSLWVTHLPVRHASWGLIESIGCNHPEFSRYKIRENERREKKNKPRSPVEQRLYKKSLRHIKKSERWKRKSLRKFWERGVLKDED